MVEVQVLEEGEIFHPYVFLDGLAQQWKQNSSTTAETPTEPFRNPLTAGPREHRDPVLLPCASEQYFAKERDQH